MLDVKTSDLMLNCQCFGLYSLVSCRALALQPLHKISHVIDKEWKLTEGCVWELGKFTLYLHRFITLASCSPGGLKF
jgi:hypothetical protein